MNNLGTINNQSSSTQFANMQKDINWLKENKKQEIKKEILQKHYEQKYKKDVKSHKTQQTVGIVSTIILAITAYSSKWKNKELNLGTFAFGAASLIWPLFKPKKEKYDAAMQKELNEVV